MITVYDMTSGTLRKELEERTQTEELAQPVTFDAYPQAELQLQEVEWSEAEEQKAEWLKHVNVADFMERMK